MEYNRKIMELEKRVTALEGRDGREMHLRFSLRTFQMVEDIRRQTSLTIPEILASAIGLWKVVGDAHRENYRVLLERDGKYEELAF